MSWYPLLLALAPLVLLVTTSFVKVSVVLGFLRAGMGASQLLPASALMALALTLSGVIMAPVLVETGRAAQPWVAGREALMDAGWEQQAKAAQEVSAPWRAWLAKHSGPQERALFVELRAPLDPPDERAWMADPAGPLVVVPAFLLTELKEAFLIGFVLCVPFFALDVAVAVMLASLQLQGVSAGAVSLPCKLLLFLMLDGWSLLVRGLVLGYA